MASDPKKPSTPAGPDRKQMMRVLIPAGAIAVIVILVAVIASLTGGGRNMSDGSDGSVNDPNLKDVGGVKVRDLKEGSGEPCPVGAKVKVHYTGWLPDGSVFDSSKEKAPVDFSLNRVVQGWGIGIPG